MSSLREQEVAMPWQALETAAAADADPSTARRCGAYIDREHAAMGAVAKSLKLVPQ